MSGLPINTIVAANGALTNITAQKPVFTATEVYAGVAIENLLATRVTGTVVSRTGNTLHLHNAELVSTNGTTATGVLVNFLNDLVVTVSDTTVVSVDQQPQVTSSLPLISVGQQLDLEGQVKTDTAGNITSVDASGALVRLAPTTAWGNLKSATPGSATVNLVALGGAQPGVNITFTGTGLTTDADPNNYSINTGTVDLSSMTANAPLFRFDGIVTPFGSAPPDFTASTVTQGSLTEQVLIMDWVSPGTTAPFLSAGSSGLVVNIGNASLGTSHVIQTGPTSIDLKSLNMSPTIVPDPSITGQFSIGNPASTTGISVFHTFASYLTQLNAVLNGTNTVLKLVAVGHWDGATFTAYRIDIVQLP
jgi:hypothetical protein